MRNYACLQIAMWRSILLLKLAPAYVRDSETKKRAILKQTFFLFIKHVRAQQDRRTAKEQLCISCFNMAGVRHDSGHIQTRRNASDQNASKRVRTRRNVSVQSAPKRLRSKRVETHRSVSSENGRFDIGGY
jgi:hypothetical protein